MNCFEIVMQSQRITREKEKERARRPNGLRTSVQSKILVHNIHYIYKGNETNCIKCDQRNALTNKAPCFALNFDKPNAKNSICIQVCNTTTSLLFSLSLSIFLSLALSVCLSLFSSLVWPVLYPTPISFFCAIHFCNNRRCRQLE